MPTKTTTYKKLKKTAVLFFFLFNALGFSQQYEISTIEVNNNNYSAYLNKIVFEDKDGFLWYSTYNGIVKEMGNSSSIFFKYNASKDQNIVETNHIFESTDNKIWSSTNEGVNILDKKTGTSKWISTTYPETNKTVAFSSAKEDSKGNVWLGTFTNYLYCYTNKGKLISTRLLKSDFSSKSAYRIYDGKIEVVEILDDDSVIVKQNNKWFRVINGLSGLIIEFPLKPEKASTVLIPNGDLLPKSTSGNYTYKNKTYQFFYIKEIDKQIIEIPHLKAQYIDRETVEKFNKPIDFISIDNTDLIGFDLQFQNNKIILSESEKFQLDRQISNAIYNNSGHICLQTEYGISKIKNSLLGFKKYLNKPVTSCRSITEDNAGNLYILTYNGIFKKNSDSDTFKEIKTIKNKQTYKALITSSYGFYKLNNTEFLFYGFTYLVYKLNINTGIIEEYESPSKSLNFIDLIHYKDTKYLLAGNKGLYQFDLSTKRFKNVSQLNSVFSIDGVAVNSVYKTKDDTTLWITTKGKNPLIKLDDLTKSVYTYSTDSKTIPLVSNSIRFVYEDNQNNIWLACTNGLQKINSKDNTYKNYTSSSGFKNVNIASVLEDKNNMWIGTFDGLVKLNKTTDAIQSFYTKDGLTHNEFNGKSSYKTKDGTLYFGSLNGVVGFNEKTVAKNNKTYKIFLTEFQKFDKQSKSNLSIPVLKDTITEFKIPYLQNYIILKFAINNIYSSEKNTYQYHIKEISDNWVDLGNYPTLQLGGLNPGDYTLKVRGFSSNGNKTNTLEYKIKISQIFYKKNWFIALNFLAIIAFFSIKNRRKRKRLKIAYDQKIKIQELEAKALRAQMNPHFIFNTLNGMQSVMILKGERAANSYFTAFSRLLRLTLDMSNTDFITIKDEIEYLKSYVALENLRLNDRLEFKFNIDQNLNIEDKVVPCMLFQPIIENSLIHGLIPKQNDLKLTINFTKKDNYLIGEIIDNGIGREAAIKERNKKNHKSWATHIMNERINISNSIMDRKIKWEIIDLKNNDISLGTKVILTIPLKNKMLTQKGE